MKTIHSLLALFCVAFLTTAARAVEYSLTDLGTLGGSSSAAFALNNLGDVVGSSITASGAEHAFLYHAGTMTDLGVLNSGDTFSRANGINDAGVVVGQSQGATSSPFVYVNGSMYLVGSLGGDYGLANDINNAGQVVGISADANGVTTAFRSTAGSMQSLGSFSPAYQFSIGYDINLQGDVTGYAATGPSTYDAFYYHNGAMQDLGNLYSDSRGFSINDAGYIAGDSVIDAAGDQHAFIWHNGIMTDLGAAGAVSSDGGAINNSNQIVGTLVYNPADSTQNSGFLYSNGVMVDINSLLVPGSGWVVQDAQDINDLGQIVGVGMINGELHAYLASPVPEPATWVLLFCGTFVWALRRTGSQAANWITFR